MNKDILVIGGAGYIGSHMVWRLAQAGLRPVVLDNLSTGCAQAIGNAKLVIGDCGDPALLDQVFAQHRFAAVMHFASYIRVSESISNPAKYYENNLVNAVVLLNAMVRHKINIFIFSSTAAIFGNPVYVPIDESHPAQPINPYGCSKWMVERLLEDYAPAYGIHYACLRYFNAAGAHPEAAIGECHEPETHLVPLILQVASGRRRQVNVFGWDYDTHDGTCIRDYVHVCDLADAHLLALDALQTGLQTLHLNLGTGQGYSVAEVIAAARKITRCRIKAVNLPKRAGDPAILIADGTAARLLGWEPKLSDLQTIIKHAWEWEKILAERVSPLSFKPTIGRKAEGINA
jgi:UDP-glucose 4-epimerase